MFSVCPDNLTRSVLIWFSFCFSRMASIEELCAVDLYCPDACVDRARLASVVSACKQLHRAGFLCVIIPSQVTIANLFLCFS